MKPRPVGGHQPKIVGCMPCPGLCVLGGCCGVLSSCGGSGALNCEHEGDARNPDTQKTIRGRRGRPKPQAGAEDGDDDPRAPAATAGQTDPWAGVTASGLTKPRMVSGWCHTMCGWQLAMGAGAPQSPLYRGKLSARPPGQQPCHHVAGRAGGQVVPDYRHTQKLLPERSSPQTQAGTGEV